MPLSEMVDLALDPTAATATAAGIAVLKEGVKKTARLTPNSKWKAELAEQREDLILEVHQHVVQEEDWDPYDEADRPLPEDTCAALSALGPAWGRAGSHEKRKILWNAFFSRFKPKFYRQGISQHFWAIAEAIEYPEAHWLVTAYRERMQRVSNRAAIVHVNEGQIAFVHAKRLDKLGLAAVSLTHRSIDEVNRHSCIFTAIVEEFIEFIWSEDLAAEPEKEEP